MLAAGIGGIGIVGVVLIVIIVGHPLREALNEDDPANGDQRSRERA